MITPQAISEFFKLLLWLFLIALISGCGQKAALHRAEKEPIDVYFNDPSIEFQSGLLGELAE